MDKKNINELNLPKNFMGKIADFFINRFPMAFLLILLIVSLGVTSLILLPKESLPEIVFPSITIQTIYPGASPTDVENLVSVKIENEIKDIDDIEAIVSDSRFGISITTVEFKEGVDVERKKVKLDNELNNIVFPEGVEPPVTNVFKTSELPLMNFSISGNYSIFKLTSFGEGIKEGIEGLSGVEEVNILGGINREIQIVLDETKLLEYDLQPTDVERGLRSLNVGIPVGESTFNDIQYSIRVDEQITTVKDIENTLIQSSTGKQVFIRDIGEVVDTSEEVNSFSRSYNKNFTMNEKETAVVLEVIRKNEADVIGTSEGIKEFLENQRGTLFPDDLSISITFDTAVNVERDLENIQSSAFSGLIVVVLVLFLFIGFREALIVSITIPLTLLLTLGILNTLDITLNTFVILGLIVALGLLVDNSIIVMENIDRIRKKGATVYEAAYAGTNQVGYPILASTSTTIAAFFPLAILPGILGAFVSTIPQTIIIAIAASFIISISITPTIYSKFVKNKEKIESIKNYYLALIFKIIKVGIIIALAFIAFYNEGQNIIITIIAVVLFGGLMMIREFSSTEYSLEESFLIQWYEKFMSFILKKTYRKLLVIGTGLLILVLSGSLLATGVLKVAFFPQNEPYRALISIDTPGGTTLENTSEIISDVERILIENPDIENFNTTVGRQEVNQGVINVLFKDEEDLIKDGFYTLETIQAQVEDIPGAKIVVEGQSSGGPPVGKPIRVNIYGQDLDQAKALGLSYIDIFESIPGVSNMDISIKQGTPQIYIDILERKAQTLGLSPQNIASQLRLVIEGVTATTIKDGVDEINVVVKLNTDQYDSYDNLSSIYVTAPNGNKIPLAAITEIKAQEGRSTIRRENEERLVFIEGDVKSGFNVNEIIDIFEENRSDIIIPEGLEVDLGGDVAGIQESFLDLFQSMILAVFLVFIILTVQFDSVLQPFIILLTVPMAAIGVFIGLVITGNEFGFYAFMGLVALVGIAVNDAIVLIDYMNYLRQEGEDMLTAVIEAGKTRFNPVLATTLTTIGGVLPLAFREVYYAQFSYALVFGLLVTTVLTLMFIPIIYSMLENLKSKISLFQGGN